MKAKINEVVADVTQEFLDNRITVTMTNVLNYSFKHMDGVVMKAELV